MLMAAGACVRCCGAGRAQWPWAVLTEHAGQDGRRGRDEFRRVHPLHAFRPLEVQEMREGIGVERQQTELHPTGETRSVAESPAATATARPRLPS
jgi:hypothetical protein